VGEHSGQRGPDFPYPTVPQRRRWLTDEQQWMDDHWPGYHNGVNLGGLLVIENWMFMRSEPPFNSANLQLNYAEMPMFNNHMWSEALMNASARRYAHNQHLRGKPDYEPMYETAFDAMWCHLEGYYTDALLDEFAEFGINSVRVPVGYWIFDDPDLYPDDTWPVKLTRGPQPHGINPDGLSTPGTLALTNVIVKLWNRNMKVMLDMHALPGCSTPYQSYAGIQCDATAPNFWGGLAEEGVSKPGGGVHPNTRAKDGKTWADVYRKIALERVVPYVEFINKILPNAIVAYEMMNEPDLLHHDASTEGVRASTVGLSKDMMTRVDQAVAFGLNDGTENYNSTVMAGDLLSEPYRSHKDRYWLDIHHYFNWPAMCNVHGKENSTISIPCVCESNLPGTPHQYEQGPWAGYMKTDLLDQGHRLYIGEWSAGLQVARSCNNPTRLPNPKQAQVMWRAQKLSFLSQYLHYRGRATNQQSSFLGDFYWAGRMGHNWNADPTVCCCQEDSDWVDFEWWDWSLSNLIRLGLAKPLSQLGWTPETLDQHKGKTCKGSFLIGCGPF